MKNISVIIFHGQETAHKDPFGIIFLNFFPF